MHPIPIDGKTQSSVQVELALIPKQAVRLVKRWDANVNIRNVRLPKNDRGFGARALDYFLRELENRDGVSRIADIEIFSNGFGAYHHFEQGVTEIVDIAPGAYLRAVVVDLKGHARECVDYKAANRVSSQAPRPKNIEGPDRNYGQPHFPVVRLSEVLAC